MTVELENSQSLLSIYMVTVYNDNWLQKHRKQRSNDDSTKLTRRRHPVLPTAFSKTNNELLVVSRMRYACKVREAMWFSIAHAL